MALTSDSPAAPRRGVFAATVVANVAVCEEHFLLRLEIAEGFPPTRPGQFVQVLCHPADEGYEPVVHEWVPDRPPRLRHPEVIADPTLLRRPFSLAGREDHGDRAVLDVIHRIVGRGTARLAALRPGAAVSVLGPLGNAFTFPTDLRQAILVGGGVGIPPMLYLARALADAARPAVAFVGATTRRLLPLHVPDANLVSTAGWPSLGVEEFARCGIETAVTTDDGTLGMRGFVTDALWRWLEQRLDDPCGTVVYTCGPEAMMRALVRGCIDRGLRCQVAMERQMACGMGTCQSCVCRTRADNELGWRYRLVCTDGPVFDAADLVWDEPGASHARREEHGKARGA